MNCRKCNKELTDKHRKQWKADMVYTDPPYGIKYDDKIWNNRTKQDGAENVKTSQFGMIKNDDIDINAFVSTILKFFGYSSRIFIWGILNGNEKVPKGSFIVWDKKTEAQKDCPFGDFDICWSKNVGWKILRHMWGGFHNKEKDENVRHHPTQKPVSLAIDFFDRWGKDKTNIVDLYLGSGSTLIACEKTNRRCFGMDIDPHYVSVIIKRWETFTGKKAHKEIES